MLLPLPVVPKSSTPATSLENLGGGQEEEGVARGRWPGGQGAEPDAARAVDAAGHDGLDERPDVLVLDGALAAKVAVGEPGPVGAEGHGLVLQVTLPALRVEGWRRWEEVEVAEVAGEVVEGVVIRVVEVEEGW